MIFQMFLHLNYGPCLFADDSNVMLVLKSNSDSFVLQQELDKLVTMDWHYIQNEICPQISAIKLQSL